jgi:two-component system, NarL family, sensor kinase
MKKTQVLALVLIAFSGFSQNKKADSLQLLVKNEANAKRKAFLLNELSMEFRNTDYKKSIGFAEQAFEVAKKIGDVEQLGRAQLSIGVENYYLGKYEEALKSYLSALKIYEDAKDNKGLASVLNELGTFNKKQGDIEKSQKNFERALTLSTEINDSSQIANSMNNLGIIYEMKEDYPTAMDYFKKSTIIKEAMNDLNGVSYNYANMGELQVSLGNFKDAENYLNKVIGIRKKLNDKTGYAIALNNLGEMLLAKKDYKLARKYLIPALELTYQINYKDLRRHVYSILAKTYDAEGNYKESYQYLIKGNEVKDSIFNEQKSQQLLEIQTKYETEKKEGETKFLKQENELKDARINENKLLIISLIGVLLGGLALGFLYRTRVQLKQQAELEATRATLRESQLKAVIGSQEEERKRFAADLHDGLGQMISAVRLGLSKENVEKSSVNHALSLLNDMNGEIRDIAFNLMPQVLMKSGLDEALKEFATRINRSGGVHINVQTYDLNRDLPSEHRIALYRISQEWVNNVIKYSGATSISIQVVQHPEELVLTIEDNGKGFNPERLTQSQGNGWKNINSRLHLIKGTIEIDSQEGRANTTVIISVAKSTAIAA